MSDLFILYIKWLDEDIATEYSTVLNLHPVYICQVFPKYFRTSFGEYIRLLKLQNAVHLFLHKQMLLTEVAYECGFADQSHFTRSFKEVYGLTPKAFKKLTH